MNRAHPKGLATTPDEMRQGELALPRSPLVGIEYRFGWLLAVFGLVFLFSLPPNQVPDENAHFLHAYDVAKGHLQPAHDSEGWAGTNVPQKFLPLIQRPSLLWGHPQERWTWQDFRGLLELPSSDKELPVSMAQVSIYTFLPYLPQAAAIRLAQWLHFPPLLLFYAGRLGGLIFGVFCVVLAIHMTPTGKLMFGGVALFPLTVQQFASLSADSATIGLTLVLVAALLRLALSLSWLELRVGGWALMLLLVFATALTKFPYTILALLYFGISPERLGSRRRYWWTGAFILTVAAIGLAVSAALTRPFVLDPHHLREVAISKSDQIHFLLTHPLKFLWICLHSTADHGWFWVLSLFGLGCLDVHLNLLSGLAYLFFLAVLAVAEGQGGELPWRLWRIGSVIVFLSTMMILTATYIWWNPPRSQLIEGPQGRYFIPLMPLFFLLLRNAGIRITANDHFLARMTLAVTVIFLTYAWTVVMNRYYFREPPVLLAPETLLSVSALALALFWAFCRWDLAKATTEAAMPSVYCSSAGPSGPPLSMLTKKRSA